MFGFIGSALLDGALRIRERDTAQGETGDESSLDREELAAGYHDQTTPAWRIVAVVRGVFSPVVLA